MNTLQKGKGNALFPLWTVLGGGGGGRAFEKRVTSQFLSETFARSSNSWRGRGEGKPCYLYRSS